MKIKMNATLKENDIVEVNISKRICGEIVDYFSLYIDGVFAQDIDILSYSESRAQIDYKLQFKDVKILPGRKYQLLTIFNEFISIDISYIGQLPWFEKKYRYDGRLGSIYSKKETEFCVFSPFGEDIILKLFDDTKTSYIKMEPDRESGVFSCVVKGDFSGFKYCYLVTMFGKTFKVIDPYCFSQTSNAEYSYVIDLSLIKSIPSNREQLVKDISYTKSIIYECSIRDLTSLLDIQNRGTIDGLLSLNDKDRGLDYIASLGVTHVQFMPVLDYQTVNDDMFLDTYNWGYDPRHYFCLKAGLSSNPNDPYKKLIDFKKIVSKCHYLNLRVNLDVVYNHCFSQADVCFNKLCPNYFFRKNQDGSLSNGSFCGNDLETRNYMVRRMIIDSLSYLLDTFDVDGFRFDLLGIIDIDTINLAYEKLAKIKPDIMLYGEGWDLPTSLPFEQKACIYNSLKTPNIAYFNDRFRDVTKGKSDRGSMHIKGYLTGDLNYIDGFKHVMLGSCKTLAFTPLFKDCNQSINYCECHDNSTLYDKIKSCCLNETEEEIQSRIKLCITTILFSCGIPLFHEGEEVCHSKNMINDSYNAGDKINGFDYRLLKKNKNILSFFKDCISLKNEFINDSRSCYEKLYNYMTFENLKNGCLKIKYDFGSIVYHLFLNPTKSLITYTFDDYSKLILTENGRVSSEQYSLNAIIPPLCESIYKEKKEI